MAWKYIGTPTPSFVKANKTSGRVKEREMNASRIVSGAVSGVKNEERSQLKQTMANRHNTTSFGDILKGTVNSSRIANQTLKQAEAKKIRLFPGKNMEKANVGGFFGSGLIENLLNYPRTIDVGVQQIKAGKTKQGIGTIGQGILDATSLLPIGRGAQGVKSVVAGTVGRQAVKRGAAEGAAIGGGFSGLYGSSIAAQNNASPKDIIKTGLIGGAGGAILGGVTGGALGRVGRIGAPKETSAIKRAETVPVAPKLEVTPTVKTKASPIVKSERTKPQTIGVAASPAGKTETLKTPLTFKTTTKATGSKPITATEANLELRQAGKTFKESGAVSTPRLPVSSKSLAKQGVELGGEYTVRRPLSARLGILPSRGYAKLDPAAGKIVKTMTDAYDYKYVKMSEEGRARAKSAFRGLNSAEREKLVELQERGLPESEVAKLSGKYRRAAQGIQHFNKDIKQIAQEEFKIDTSKWKYDSSNYFHHMFVGDQAVVQNGKIVFIGKRGEALRKVEELLNKGAKPQEVSMKPRFTQGDVPTVLLSQKGFWAFVNKMSKKLETSADEVLEEMAGVAATKPRPTFVGAFKSRRANLEGYLKDPERVYSTLWDRLARKQHLEPAAKSSGRELSNIKTPWLKKEMEEYIQAVKGKYEDPDYLLGLNVSKLTQYLTKAQSMLKLGYRPRTAIINRLQPLQTAWSDLGRYYWLAEGKQYSAHAKQIIEEIGSKAAPGKYEVGGYKRINSSKNPVKPLGMFQAAESGNRAVVSYGSYLKGRAAGMDHNTAISYARSFDNAANFSYSVAGLGKAFRNAYVKMFFQFRPFALNFIMNANRVMRGKPLAGLEQFEKYFPLTKTEQAARMTRFLTGNLLLGGAKFITSPLVQGTLAYTAIKHPKVFQGVLSNLGIDISSSVGADPTQILPQSTESTQSRTLKAVSQLGPAGTDVVNVLTTLDKYRKSGNEKDLIKLLRANPAAWDVYKAFKGDEGASESVKMNSLQRIFTGTGFTPSKVSTSNLALGKLHYFVPELRTTNGLPTPHAISLMSKNLEKDNYDPKKKAIIRALFKSLDISQEEIDHDLSLEK